MTFPSRKTTLQQLFQKSLKKWFATLRLFTFARKNNYAIWYLKYKRANYSKNQKSYPQLTK
ncbi:hypothetical protein, partial [Flavobacterium gilvum]|uniref:hypothetical protein n=1 Tax=Flavobacterium gilvum TaxID=1492737 RepID=UPI001E5A0409